ncbi:MAG: rod shape-determining protein [Bacteroidales bacterium]|nr:rod shape-determining protein [Bacteroidales bacterium]
MIFAAIDIGSNAVRLLFANAFQQEGKIRVEKATLIRIPIRLGMDVYNTNKISKERASKLIKTLEAFSLLIDVYKPRSFTACATAAMREAVNGLELIKKIKKQTGINVRLIDGLEEAAIIRASDDYAFPQEKKLTMYVDLGGGSTEISVLSKHKLIEANSFKIGTLRLLSDKVPDSEWKAMEEWLMQFKEDFGMITVIGSGGNINKIAKIYGKPDETNLSFENLEYASRHLKSFDLDGRIERLGLRPDRADVIVPATDVFLFITRVIQANSVYVPKIGLADGLIYQMFEAYLKKKNK